MEQQELPKLNSVPVPTPCESFSFLATDDDDYFLAVTPEKTFSRRVLPITESLKESSFLDDEDKTKTKVQFNRSVSVFQFSPDRTLNMEEEECAEDYFNYHQGLSSADTSRFDYSLGSSLKKSSEEILSQYERISHLAKKIDEIDINVRRHYSTGSLIRHFERDGELHRKKASRAEGESETPSFAMHFESPKNSPLLESQESLVITDIHSNSDEVIWDDKEAADHYDDDSDHQEDDNGGSRSNIIPPCTSVSRLPEKFAPKNVSAVSDKLDSSQRPKSDLGALKLKNPKTSPIVCAPESGKENIPTREVAEKNHLPKQVLPKGYLKQKMDLKVVRGSVEAKGSCPMARPVPNTTLKYSADVENLKRQSFEKEALDKGKLKDPKLQSKIEGKALSKLNASEDHFKDLVSIDVKEEEIRQKVKEKMSKVKREKFVKVEDRISRMPEAMDFYNEDYFVRESPPSFSGISVRPFKPKLKMADPDGAMECYRRMLARGWFS